MYKIKHKLYLSYTVIITVLCAAMLATYMIARGSIEKSATENVQNALNITAQNIEAINENIGRMYDLVYNSSDARGYINQMRTANDLYLRHYNYGKLNRLMNDFVHTVFTDANQYEVLICSGDGEVYYYSWTLSLPDAEGIRQDLASGAGRPVASGFRVYSRPSYSMRNLGEEYLYYSCPLPNNIYYKSPDLSVIIGIRLSDFRAVYSDAYIENSSFLFLDSEGDPVPVLQDGEENRAASDRIHSTAYLPSVGWTVQQSIPSSHVLSDLNRWSRLVLLGIAALAAATILVCVYISNHISRPIQYLYTDMQAIKSGRWECVHREKSFPNDEIGALSIQFYDMVENIQELNRQMLEKEQQKRVLEFKALQAQINPHFMYNTLGSVKMLVHLDRREDAASALTALNGILKDTLGKTGQTISLEQEIKILNSYIYIQKLRYGDFQFHIYADKELYPLRMMRFIIQPFVENSICHAYDQIDESAVIIVTFQSVPQKNLLEVCVQDNGKGMDENTLQMVLSGQVGSRSVNGIGAGNVIERIQLTYGEPCGVTFESARGKGTTARIHLPLLSEEPPDA